MQSEHVYFKKINVTNIHVNPYIMRIIALCLTLLVIVIFYLGVNAQPLTDFFTAVAAGM